jgi:uncharacterized protein (TIGR02598 family)
MAIEEVLEELIRNSMNKIPHRARRPANSQGFTLVEVCLSMGIIAVTLIPLMGLMANGLMQVGSNLDSNQAAIICQQVYVAAQQQSFSQLATTTSYTNYFTAEGDPVATSGSPAIVYAADVTCSKNSVTAPTPPLITLSIKIRKAPSGQDISSNPSVATFVGTVGCSDISGYNVGSD